MNRPGAVQTLASRGPYRLASSSRRHLRTVLREHSSCFSIALTLSPLGLPLRSPLLPPGSTSAAPKWLPSFPTWVTFTSVHWDSFTSATTLSSSEERLAGQLQHYAVTEWASHWR
jgi:hypothetical protein